MGDQEFAGRFLAFVFGLVMAASLAACGGDTSDEVGSEEDPESVESDDGGSDDEASDDESGDATDDSDGDGSDGEDSDGDASEADDEVVDADEAADGSGLSALELSAEPTEWVRQVLLPAEAFPSGYTITDTTDTSDDDQCLGQPATIVEHPPVAFAAEDANGDNIAATLVARYASEADAAAAFTYFKSLEELCNENWLSDEENDFSSMYVQPISPAAIDGVERLTATKREVHGPDFVISLDLYGAQFGDALLLAMSTDSDAAKQLIVALTQRAQGLDVAGPLTFGGPMEPLPGFRSPDYWSWPSEGPLTVRQSLDSAVASQVLSAAAVEWLNTATDDRIDKLASEACVVSHDLTENDDLDSVVFGVYTPEELAASDPYVLGEAFGYTAGVYCPALAEKLAFFAGG